MNLSLRRPTASEGASDSEIVRRSLTSPSEFGELFARHGDAIFRFAATRVGPERAEDVTAETFMRAFDIRGRYRLDATSARPWLYGITVKVLHKNREAERSWYERAARLRSADTATEAPQENVADIAISAVDAAAVRPVLEEALHHLSERERDVLLLHAVAGMTHFEIADLLNVRPGTAKSLLSRGCARLRIALTNIERD